MSFALERSGLMPKLGSFEKSSKALIRFSAASDFFDHCVLFSPAACCSFDIIFKIVRGCTKEQRKSDLNERGGAMLTTF